MKILGLDLETTGLDWTAGHKIMEVAIVVCDEHGNEKGAFARRYNPQRPVDPGAQAVHGISYEDVSSELLFKEHAGKIANILNSADLIVAHNGLSFDLPFLNHELLACGAPIVTAPVCDTMEEGRWATPFGKNPNLGELCFACNVPYDPERAHAALYDVRVMLQSYFWARRKGFFGNKVTHEERLAA